MSEINGSINGTMPIHETPATAPADLKTLKAARQYLVDEIEDATEGMDTDPMFDQVEKLDDQIAAIEYPDPSHPIHRIRELQKTVDFLKLEQGEYTSTAKKKQFQPEIDRLEGLIQQLSAPLEAPPALEPDDQDDEDQDDSGNERVLSPDEAEIVQAMRRGDYNEAVRLSFKKEAEKPVILAPDEHHHLTSYRIRRDKYQETHPGEFPDLVLGNRYDFDEIGPEYQMSLYLMSELAFAGMLPANMIEGGQAGTDGKVFFDFFNTLAGAVSDGLDKVDIAELTQHHHKK